MISGIFTTLAFVAFIATGVWALMGRNRKRFEEAAALPLTEDETVTLNQPAKAAGQAHDCGCGGCQA